MAEPKTMAAVEAPPSRALQSPPGAVPGALPEPKTMEELEAQPCDKRRPEKAQLSAAQRRMRWKTTLAAMSLDAIPGIYVGSSPWVDFMNRTVPPGMSRWLAPGVTQPGIFMVTGLCLYFPLLGYLMRRKAITVRAMGVLAVLGTAFPLSIGITAAGGGFWVQYAGAAIGGFGLVAAQFIEKIVAIQWWALTGDAAKGATLMGGSVGLWSLAFTLLSAVLCDEFGLEVAMCWLACIIFLSTLYPLWLALRGELQAPEPEDMCKSSIASASRDGGKEAPEAEAFSLSGALCSMSFWQLLFHFFATFFFGFGTKALLSPIFQVAYGVGYLESACLAAIVLAFYAAMRSGLPLMTRRLPLAPVCMGLAAFSAVLYACSPAIVRWLPVWWLVLAKTLSGASFAGLSTLRNLLALEMYGPTGLAHVLPLLEVGVGLGKLIGPVTGYYIYLTDEEIGDSSHSAYNPFFYTCAAVAAVDALNLLALYVRTRR